MTRHTWVEAWWVWVRPEEPTTSCVPIEDVHIDYAATGGSA